MEIDQKYFQRIAHELDTSLTDVASQHGIASPLYKLLQNLRAVVLTLVDDIVHPLQNNNPELHKKIAGDNERARTPYEELELRVNVFIEKDEIVKGLEKELTNLTFKINRAKEKREDARTARTSCYERLYTPLQIGVFFFQIFTGKTVVIYRILPVFHLFFKFGVFFF